MPGVLIRNARTMEGVIARQMAQRRFNMLLLGMFGLLGLVIAAVGIYGVTACVVTQRTREIGLRMALGASRGRVMTMVLRQSAVRVAAGLIAGGAGAWFLGSTAERFLFRTEVNDPRAFAAALATLAAAALAATIVPARRAAKVDPAIALRAE
jgi:ABC-type antimicrobial peptide transport system permease subunit